MIDYLYSIPGKLKTLMDRLTATRASNLDNLDAPISAISPINSIQSGELYDVNLSLNSTGVNGPFRYYYDITISAVDVSKSIVLGEIYSSNSGTYAGTIWIASSITTARVNVKLLNSTTIRIGLIRNVVKYAAGTWQVIEYK